jgi:hypothetical protein
MTRQQTQFKVGVALRDSKKRKDRMAGTSTEADDEVAPVHSVIPTDTSLLRSSNLVRSDQHRICSMTLRNDSFLLYQDESHTGYPSQDVHQQIQCPEYSDTNISFNNHQLSTESNRCRPIPSHSINSHHSSAPGSDTSMYPTETCLQSSASYQNELSIESSSEIGLSMLELSRSSSEEHRRDSISSQFLVDIEAALGPLELEDMLTEQQQKLNFKTSP